MTRSFRRRLAAVLLVPAVIAGLAACASEPEKEPSAAERSDEELRTIAEPEWELAATPVGSSVNIVQGVALAYVLGADDRLSLVGVDVETGEERWSTPASTGSIDNEVSIRPTIVTTSEREPLVAALTRPVWMPGGSYAHRIRLLDPQDGSLVRKSDPIWVMDLRHCRTDDGLCFEGELAGADRATYRFDVETGEIAPFDDLLPGYDWSRPVGGGVFVAEQSGTEYLLAFDDHDIDTQPADVAEDPVWRIETSKLFGEGRTLAHGLGGQQWVEDDDEATLLVWRAPDRDDDDGYRLEDFTILAVDGATGELRWMREGATICQWRTVCTGEIAWEPKEGGSFAGFLSYRQQIDAVTLEYIDAATGDAEWSVDIDDYSDDVIDGASFGGIDGYRGVGDGGTARLIDVETGKVRSLDDEEHTACWVDLTFVAPAYSHPLRDDVTFRSGSALVSCGPDGEDGSELSKAAVRSGAMSWAPEDEKWRELEDGPGDDDPLDEWFDRDDDEDDARWRIAQTEDGLVGYRF